MHGVRRSAEYTSGMAKSRPNNPTSRTAAQAKAWHGSTMCFSLIQEALSAVAQALGQNSGGSILLAESSWDLTIADARLSADAAHSFFSTLSATFWIVQATSQPGSLELAIHPSHR